MSDTEQDGKTMYLVGCAITDEVHQLDPSITGQFVMWNITRIQRDANFGMFGPPIRRPCDVVPEMTDAERLNIDFDKVSKFMFLADVYMKPILTVQHGIVRRIVDGNHRLCARKRLGLTTFETYIVPPDVEKNYRVRCYVDGKEVPLPYD